MFRGGRGTSYPGAHARNDTRKAAARHRGGGHNVRHSKCVNLHGRVPSRRSLANADRIEVSQRVLLGEAFTLGCCEQQNIFDIKIDGRDGPRVLLAKEQSKCCDRFCCNPHHSLLVHVSPAFQSDVVYMTLERKGCEFFKCCASPRPFLSCFTCSECCTEEVIIHDGGVFGHVGELDSPNPVAVLRQPMQCCKAGGCTPTVHVYPATSADVDPIATITGPTCFGGCSELCFESNFTYKSTTDGDIRIQHLIPRSIGEICKAICTDSDNYALEFPSDASPETRAQALASAFLLGMLSHDHVTVTYLDGADYMFFEIDNGMCRYDPGQQVCIITCCLCVQ